MFYQYTQIFRAMEAKNTDNNTIERMGVRYGILMSLALVGYFLLMKALNLEHNLELRALNLFILISFVLMAIKRYKQKKEGHLPYLRGIGLGLLTSAVGTISFALLFTVYITVISPEFMEVIRSQETIGTFMNPLLVAFTLTIEGIASGFMVTFGIMQYYKPSHSVEEMQVG
jgi:hypothetical protein